MLPIPEPEPYLEPPQELTLDEVLKYPVQFESENYAPAWLDPQEARKANEQALALRGSAKLWKEYFNELLTINEQEQKDHALEKKAQALQCLQPTEEVVDTFFTHLASSLTAEDIAMAQAPEAIAFKHLQAALTNRALTLLANANRLTINGVPNEETLAQEALALKITTELSQLNSPKIKQSHTLANSIKDINPQFFTARLLS